MTNDTIIDFDAAKTRRYLDLCIDGFINDPPDSDFQAGFLGAVVVIYREVLGKTKDARLDLCERLIKNCQHI